MANTAELFELMEKRRLENQQRAKREEEENWEEWKNHFSKVIKKWIEEGTSDVLLIDLDPNCSNGPKDRRAIRTGDMVKAIFRQVAPADTLKTKWQISYYAYYSMMDVRAGIIITKGPRLVAKIVKRD